MGETTESGEVAPPGGEVAPPWRRYLGLAFACLSITMGGTILNFTTFAVDLKDEFQLSQHAVELTAAMGNIGAALGFPAGLIYERLGTTWTYALAGLLTGVSSILMFTTQYSVQFYHDHWGLILFYWTVYGFGTVFMVLVSTSVSIENFPARHRGLVVGGTSSFILLGPTLFSALYAAGFRVVPVGDYFSAIAACMIVINLLSMLFIRVLPREPEEAKETTCLLAEHVTFVSDKEIAEESLADRLGWPLLAISEFELMTWGFVFTGSIQLLYITNVTIYSDSYSLKRMDLVMSISGPVFGMIISFVSGWASDRSVSHVTRLLYVVVSVVVQTLFFLVCIWYGHELVVYVCTTLVVYASNGTLFSIIPTLVSEYFGTRHFVRNWGTMLMVNALLSLGISAIFAVFYEQGIQREQYECKGLRCFWISYLICTCLSALSVLCFFVLSLREHKNRKKG